MHFSIQFISAKISCCPQPVFSLKYCYEYSGRNKIFSQNRYKNRFKHTRIARRNPKHAIYGFVCKTVQKFNRSGQTARHCFFRSTGFRSFDTKRMGAQKRPAFSTGVVRNRPGRTYGSMAQSVQRTRPSHRANSFDKRRF